MRVVTDVQKCGARSQKIFECKRGGDPPPLYFFFQQTGGGGWERVGWDGVEEGGGKMYLTNENITM